jgi:hypothetical protein
VTINRKSIGGIIHSSLYESLLEQDAPVQLAYDLSKIFATRVDFFKPGFLNREILPNENTFSFYKIMDYTDCNDFLWPIEIFGLKSMKEINIKSYMMKWKLMVLLQE